MTSEPKKAKKNVHQAHGDSKKLDATLERRNPAARDAPLAAAKNVNKHGAGRQLSGRADKPVSDKASAAKAVAQNFQKTMALPELQEDDLVPKRKPQSCKVDFAKTAVIPELAREPIAAPGTAPERTVNRESKENRESSEVNESGNRLERRRRQPLPSRSSNSGLWFWLVVILLILATLVFRKLF